MSNRVVWKQKLYEILAAEAQRGGELSNCDVILTTPIDAIPQNVWTFLVLGEFFYDDVLQGQLQDRGIVIRQTIYVVSIVKKTLMAEQEAEYRAYDLARRVRKVLKKNLTLGGLAKKSELEGVNSEYGVFGGSKAVLMLLNLRIWLLEA